MHNIVDTFVLKIDSEMHKNSWRKAENSFQRNFSKYHMTFKNFLSLGQLQISAYYCSITVNLGFQYLCD